MEKKLTKGLFIAFEGPEGCGKSTQAKRVYEELSSDGYEAVYTAEPGGTPLGGKIREILLMKDGLAMGNGSELFLFEADRAQHVEEVIRPAIEAGKIVICDRYNTATFAYQGYGLGMDMDFVKKVDGFSTGGLAPDLTILLDVDVVTGLERAGKVGPADRMEKRSVGFHEKVREGYLAMAEASPDRFRIIDVHEDKDRTYRSVKEEVYGAVERHKRAG